MTGQFVFVGTITYLDTCKIYNLEVVQRAVDRSVTCVSKEEMQTANRTV